MQLIDFRDDNRWGHAIHGSTFSIGSAPNRLERIIDRWRCRRRYSFLVHCGQWPMIGDEVAWTVEAGERRGTIYAVKHFYDPKDMHRLSVVIK